MTKETPDRRSRQYRVHCPHCRARAIVRSSVTVTDGARQLHLHCSDPECGHVFGAIAEVRISVTHTIVPSLKPADDVQLRIAPLRRRAGAAAVTIQLARPIAANDSGPEVPPLAANDDAAPDAAHG